MKKIINKVIEANAIFPIFMIILLSINQATANILIRGGANSQLSFVKNKIFSESEYHRHSGIKNEGGFFSRWNIEGNLDIGDKVNTTFFLESHLNSNENKGLNKQEIFWDQSYLQIFHEKLGSVSIGRQYNDLSFLSSPDSRTDPVKRERKQYLRDSSILMNNSIKYQSPEINKSYFALTYSHHPNLKQAQNNSAWSTGFFLKTPITIGVNYSTIKQRINSLPQTVRLSGNKLHPATTIYQVQNTHDEYSTQLLSNLKKVSIESSYEINNTIFKVLGSRTATITKPNILSARNSDQKKQTTISHEITFSSNYKATEKLSLGMSCRYKKQRNNMSLNQFGIHTYYSVTKNTGFYLIGLCKHLNQSQKAKREEYRSNLFQKQFSSQFHLTTGLRYEF